MKDPGKQSLHRSAVTKADLRQAVDLVTELMVIPATGGYRVAIGVHGIASHAGGAPEIGVSASAIAVLAIADLVRRGWHGNVRKGKQRGTSNVGYISGGEASNVVTDHVQLKAEARSHDPAFRERILHEVQRAFQRAAGRVKNIAGDCGRVEFDGHLDYESFYLELDDPSVIAAEHAIRVPVRAISNGGIDANWMVARGIPTVTLGCGQVNQQMVTEALDIKGFENACCVALHLATASEALLHDKEPLTGSD